MKNITKELKAQYSDLQQQINLLEAGECKATDVKKKSSLLGIYGERNGAYMLRIRRAAGETTPQNLRDIAQAFENYGIDHAHFSTRQDIQLHGTPGANVENTLNFLSDHAMPFRGGGGNTFRNVSTSPYTGIAADSVFDTTPHAQGVWDWVYGYDRAYLFGRKFKLGFSCVPSDDSNGFIQDLGFIAKIVDGVEGFEVWCGGGMGRGASLGVKLFDFLLPKDIIRVSQAGIDLFYEEGNREVRSKARLRFVLQERGEAEFRRLFENCYAKADAPDYVHVPRSYDTELRALKESTTAEPTSDAYTSWVSRSVTPTKFDDVVSVRLFIKGGNFNQEQLRDFAEVMDELSIPFLRVSIEQDAILPLVHRSALGALFTLLEKKLPAQQSTTNQLTGQIHSCIGAANCPIGVLKAPEAAQTIGVALDQFFAERSDKDAHYNEILDGIRVSGCGSSCGLNQVAVLGFTGGKKRLEGEATEIYEIWVGGKMDNEGQIVSVSNKEWWVKASDIGTFVVQFVADYLAAKEADGTIDFRSYGIARSATFAV